MTDVAKILVGGITYPIKAPSVEDNGRNGDNLKFWTGVRTDYETLVDNLEIDDETLYYLTDTHEIYLGVLNIANYSGVRNIGEIVTSTLPLVDAGLHLLDGSVIASGGIYDAFVNYIERLWNDTPASSYTMNVTAVGSPTINTTTGIVSNFTAANYVYPATTVSFSAAAATANTWEEVFKFRTTTIGAEQSITGGNGGTWVHDVLIGTNGTFTLRLSSNGTSYDIFAGAGTHVVTANTDYWVKLEFTGTQYILSYSTNGQDFTPDITVNSVVHIESTPDLSYLGVRGNLGGPLSGSIDLKQCYIRINGVLWWNGATPVKRGFCTEAEWEQSITVRGCCGKYVWDSENRTVRIPKIVGFERRVIDENVVGVSAQPLTLTSGATQQVTNALCYVVIAEGYKLNVEVNIDNAVAALNEKVDKADLREVQCLVEKYRSGTSWYRIYSDGWCEQGGRVFISSGATVTVSLLKPFIDNNYGILHSYYVTSGVSYGCRVTTVNSTFFQLYNYTIDSYVTWHAEGYIL